MNEKLWQLITIEQISVRVKIISPAGAIEFPIFRSNAKSIYRFEMIFRVKNRIYFQLHQSALYAGVPRGLVESVSSNGRVENLFIELRGEGGISRTWGKKEALIFLGKMDMNGRVSSENGNSLNRKSHAVSFVSKQSICVWIKNALSLPKRS